MSDSRYSSPHGDSHVQHLHTRAMGGDEEARTNLMLWVYHEAKRYYAAKVIEHASLSTYDAQELTSQFLLYFESSWRSVRRVHNYTRRGLRQNLVRYLSARRRHTISIDDLDARSLLEITTEQSDSPWMDWSDEAFDLYTAVALEYFSNPDTTVELVESRLECPDEPYSEICSRLGISEGAARTRVYRFFKRVRLRLETSQAEDENYCEQSLD